MSKLSRWGLAEAELCTLCGDQDSTHHRAYGRCAGCPEDLEEEEDAKVRAAASWNGYRDAGGPVEKEVDGLASAWFPRVRRPEGPWSAIDLDVEVGGDGTGGGEGCEAIVFRKSGGPVFLDGSCLHPLAQYAAAAGAAVQVNAEGEVTAWVTFRVPPDFDQSAAAAEHLAVIVAAARADGEVQFVTDCAGVFSCATRGRRFATGERRPWASVWREIAGERPFGKVKAHLTREQAAERGEADWWAGNDAADRMARARAAKGLPPQGVMTGIDALISGRERYYRGVAGNLAKFPSTKGLIVPRAPAAAVDQLVVYHGHSLVWCPTRKVWWCRHCLRRARPGQRSSLQGAECARTGDLIQQVTATAFEFGHDPYVGFVTGGGPAVVACVRCGGYSESVFVRLGTPCTGRTAPGGTAHRLRRFMAGRHPREEATLDGPHRVARR